MHLLLWNNIHLFNQMQLHKNTFFFFLQKISSILYTEDLYISMHQQSNLQYNRQYLTLSSYTCICIEGKKSCLKFSLSQRSNKVLILLCNITTVVHCAQTYSLYAVLL